MKPLRIALTKGRIEKSAGELFEKTGLDVSILHDKGRQLILPVPDSNIEFVLAKPADVLTFVEYGACDMGVVGKDTLLEAGRLFYEVMDLGFGKCRFCVAAKKGADFYAGYGQKRIASKYPHVARTFFEGRNMDVEVIKIEGSVELAPLLGMADAIVDIVETGSTLKANGLEVIDEIAPISARLIVNTASMKLRKLEIEQLIEKLERVVNSENI